MMEKREGVLYNNVLCVSELHRVNVGGERTASIKLQGAASAVIVVDVIDREESKPTLLSYSVDPHAGGVDTIDFRMGKEVRTSSGTVQKMVQGFVELHDDATGSSSMVFSKEVFVKRGIGTATLALSFDGSGEAEVVVSYNLPLKNLMLTRQNEPLKKPWHWGHVLLLPPGRRSTEDREHALGSLVTNVTVSQVDVFGHASVFNKLLLYGKAMPGTERQREPPTTRRRMEYATQPTFVADHTLTDVSIGGGSVGTWVSETREVELSSRVLYDVPHSTDMEGQRPTGVVLFADGVFGVLTHGASMLPAIPPGVVHVKEGMTTVGTTVIDSQTRRLSLGEVSSMIIVNEVVREETVSEGARMIIKRHHKITIKNSANESQVLTLVVRGAVAVVWDDVEHRPAESGQLAIELEVDAEGSSTTVVQFEKHIVLPMRANS